MKVVAKGYFDVIGASQDDGLVCPEPSLAVQASKDECDINVIVKKYMRTGELPGLRQGIYADISAMPDLADAIQMVNYAEQAFMELPAEVRRHFDNDPIKLVEFASDAKNYAKAVELGLVASRPTPPSQPVANEPKGDKTTAPAVPPTST